MFHDLPLQGLVNEGSSAVPTHFTGYPLNTLLTVHNTSCQTRHSSSKILDVQSETPSVCCWLWDCDYGDWEEEEKEWEEQECGEEEEENGQNSGLEESEKSQSLQALDSKETN